MGASLGIGGAQVTDIFPPQGLGSGLSLFYATMWIGLIFGSALGGAAIQNLGLNVTLMIGAFLSLLTIFLAIPIRGTAMQTVEKAGS